MSSDDSKRQADAPDAPDAKKPKPAPAAIYDDIAVDYAAVRANPFKRHVDVEEATFLRAVGDVAGKGVLDLACGTGHYARLLKARGAANVHGVDNSEELLKEARRHESADGVTYYRHESRGRRQSRCSSRTSPSRRGCCPTRRTSTNCWNSARRPR